MKSVMKKLFSLLLVGVVTVSMFGFVAPLVEAAEANASGDQFIITSYLELTQDINVTTSIDGNKSKSFTIPMDKPIKRKKPLQYSFKVSSSRNRVELSIFVKKPSNPKIHEKIDVAFYKNVKSKTQPDIKEKAVIASVDSNGRLKPEFNNKNWSCDLLDYSDSQSTH